jgi:2-polyprenyl-6-methoxyphenol hydroxylase-like FAD-dependent oxidoreductase
LRVVVVGGSAAGLSVGLLLARAGHQVTIVDQAALVPAPDVESAASAAVRVSAPQLVQPHAVLARGRQLLAERLPDALESMLLAGAVESRLVDQMPPTLGECAPEPGDDELSMLLTRRSTFDWALLRLATAQPGLTLLGSTRVSGLLAEAGRPPRVRGVTSTAGALEADAVVDASGRRSPIAGWLAAAGAAPVRRDAAECGLAYFSRHYRRRPGVPLPGPAATRLLMAFDEFTAGLWAADNGTMLFAVAPLTADHRFRTITDPDVFTAVLRTVPVFAAWLDVLEPSSGVYAMGGLHNTFRRLVVDGRPAVSGLYQVGDSVCTTNPTLGRGLTLALQGAVDLVDVLAGCGDPHEAALEVDRRVGQYVEPIYLDQARTDASRLAALRHVVFGAAPPTPPAQQAGRLEFGRLRMAAMIDPIALRRLFRLLGLLEMPESVYTDEKLAAHVTDVLSREAVPRPAQPSRAELLAALEQAPAPVGSAG